MYISKTACKRCGQRILMIRLDSGKTVPCDMGLVEFVPEIYGTATYVTEDGTKIRGVEPDPGDMDIHKGYIDHRVRCPRTGGNQR